MATLVANIAELNNIELKDVVGLSASIPSYGKDMAILLDPEV